MPYETPDFDEEAALCRLKDYQRGLTIPVIAALRRSGKLEAAHVVAAGQHYRVIELANGQRPETGEGEHMHAPVTKLSYDGGVVALVDARASVESIREAMGDRLYATLEAVLACGLSARAIAAARGETKDVTVGRIVAALDSLVDFQRLSKNRIQRGYNPVDTGGQL
jgi:hypothetical protein